MATSYTPEGYGAIRGGCQQSAAAVVPILHDLVAPTRIVDVGGGEGWWAAQFAILGCEATVVDDSSPEHAKIRGVRFERSDLSADPAVIPEADLALCLEVAEHLSALAAEPLVDLLCGLGDLVVFSAAQHEWGGAAVSVVRTDMAKAALLSRPIAAGCPRGLSRARRRISRSRAAPRVGR